MRTLFLSAAALTAAASFTSCGRTEAHTRPNVVLVCLDTVRADRLGCYGYDVHPATPHLDALAEEAVVFRDTSSTAGWTKPSVPSFMTGTLPIQHGVYEGSARGVQGAVSDVLPESAETLAEVFRTRGYQSAAIIENAQLRRGNGFEQGFDVYDDRGGDAREIRWKARDWLEERDPAQPFFLYLHFLDAHWPFHVPAEYSTKFSGQEAVALFQGVESRDLRDAINDGERQLTEDELASLEGLYAGSIRYIDDELGRLFAYLERAGLDENTIVCVVADHGEEFLEHGRVGHGHGLWENLLSVPWILRVPGRAPARVETPVSLVDLFPTLLAAADILAPETHVGIDRLLEPDAQRPLYAEHKEPRAYVQSVRSGHEKIVRRALPLELGEVARDVTPGTAWEAKLRRADDGGLVAVELQPGEDDGEPAEIELKARVEALAGESFRLAGVPARWHESTAFYGEIDSAGDLREGSPVKVKGALVEGVLVARRVKGYEDDVEFDDEVRGPVTAADLEGGVGTLAFGGVPVRVTQETDWDLPDPDMQRDAILGFVDREEGGFDVSRLRFDLAADAGEQSGREADADPLVGLLDDGFASFVRSRLWVAGDRRALDSETLDDLRGIGYVK